MNSADEVMHRSSAPRIEELVFHVTYGNGGKMEKIVTFAKESPELGGVKECTK